MVFVVSDPHGYRDDLVAALISVGLVDRHGGWAGQDARLYVLGDLFDRGPDGVGVVEALMRWEGQAANAGGAVRVVLGNHEALALGMYRFGPEGVSDDHSGADEFATSWLLNGGQVADQRRLTADHVRWLLSLPSVLVEGDTLLVHSDTLEYLEWGSTAEEINAAVCQALAGDDPWQSMLCWRRLTDRYAFSGADGARAASLLLDQLGGRRIVHGHTIIGDLLGVEPREVSGPLLYADGLALAVDGGRYAGGPLLVADLDADLDAHSIP